MDEAVNRVGFGEILRLVGIASVAGLADRALTFYGIGAERMREALLIHALASEALARYADVDPLQAYTGGLLRSLGIMVLDRIARDRKPAPEPFASPQFSTYLEWEHATFGVNNTDVTTTVLDEWRFSPELVSALQRHLLARDDDYDDRLACVLNLAGSLVFDAGLALPGEAAMWTPTANKLSATGIDAGQMRDAAEEVRVVFERQRTAFC